MEKITLTSEELAAVEILKKMEPVFVEAAEKALEWQKGIKSRRKTESGHEEVDIVTEADLNVQELILKRMAETPLVECNLWAEEETPSVLKFNPNGKLYLTVDPINGTLRYSQGKDFFDTIVGLHNDAYPIYTFSYYPALNWKHKMIGSEYWTEGRRPKLLLPPDAKKTIVYSRKQKNPEEQMPELYKKYTAMGLVFKYKRLLNSDAGATALFMGGYTAGYFGHNPNVYDGLVAFHYARAKNYTLNIRGIEDLGHPSRDQHGLYYVGSYLAVTV